MIQFIPEYKVGCGLKDDGTVQEINESGSALETNDSIPEYIALCALNPDGNAQQVSIDEDNNFKFL
jgi:hypothetical protein